MQFVVFSSVAYKVLLNFKLEGSSYQITRQSKLKDGVTKFNSDRDLDDDFLQIIKDGKVKKLNSNESLKLFEKFSREIDQFN